MEYHIDLLISLQKLDLIIDDRKKFIENFEALNTKLNEESRQAGEQIDAQKERLEETKKSLRSAERKLETGEEHLKQAQTKLNNAKTNREYEAGIKEIDEQKKRNSDLEGEILLLMDEVEKQEQEIKLAINERTTIEDDLIQRRKELEVLKTRAEKDISDAELERNKTAPDLPDEMLEMYDRLRNHFGNPVVVRAKDETCTACHYRMPAQFYNEVLKGERMITCSNCQKILIIREKDLAEELELLCSEKEERKEE